MQTAYLTFILFASLFIAYKNEKYTFMLLKNISLSRNVDSEISATADTGFSGRLSIV